MKKPCFLWQHECTIATLRKLAEYCCAFLPQQGGVIYLLGDLGSGKTTFCRLLLRALGYQGVVRSPTFTLIERYIVNATFSIVHSDFYRINDPTELEYLGLSEYCTPHTLMLIEWAEKAPATMLPPADALIEFHFTAEPQTRQVMLKANTSKGYFWIKDFPPKYGNIIST